MFDLELTGSLVAFFMFAIMVVGGSILMINFTKVVHMVVSVLVTFIGIAGLFVLLHAEFLAFVQVLIYAGAIAIVIIFGIMMTNHQQVDETRPWHEAIVALGTIALFGGIFYAIQNTQFSIAEPVAPETDNALEIGKLLFTTYAFPFELMSVLLTVAFIGAIVLAKREES